MQAAEAAEASSDEEDDEQLLPGEEDFDAEAGSDDDVSEHDSAQLDAGSSDEEASDATAVAAEDVPSTADKDRRSSHQVLLQRSSSKVSAHTLTRCPVCSERGPGRLARLPSSPARQRAPSTAPTASRSCSCHDHC